jgi:hypothetical protein
VRLRQIENAVFKIELEGATNPQIYQKAKMRWLFKRLRSVAIARSSSTFAAL